MSAKTGTMNLKDAFAYMNFLSQQLREAYSLIDSGNERLDVTPLNANFSYILEKRIVRRFSLVNPDLEDSESTIEKRLDYDITADELIMSLEAIRAEREKCALAISSAKKKLPRDLDAEISLNKERHELINTYRSLLLRRNSRAEIMDKSFKFDNDGRQTVYSVPATVCATVEFDRGEVRRRSEELSRTAKEVSGWIDCALVTTEVDFTPAWDVNDGLEDIVRSIRK